MSKLSKNTKIAIIALIALVLLAVVLLLVWKSTRAQPVQGAKTLTVAVTHLDGTERTLTLHTDQEFLLGALNEAGLVVGYDSEYGFTVDTVDGERADAGQGQWWVFTKAGQWVDTDVSTTPIYDGDSYEFSVYVG